MICFNKVSQHVYGIFIQCELVQYNFFDFRHFNIKLLLTV